MSSRSLNILAAGATSLIAQETLREYAERHKCNFILAARDEAKLKAFAEDLTARGAGSVKTIVGDLIDTAFHKQIVEFAAQAWDKTDLALLAWGLLGDDAIAQKDYKEAKKIVVVNGTSYISLLTELGNYFATQRSGTIAVITSVAGDRGRRSNYVYGSSKAFVSSYVSGLRAHMTEYGVRVIDIRPGPVSTPMTAHVPKGPLMADAAAVGRSIYRSIRRRQAVIYVPWFWRWIMLLIKCLPHFVFNRLKF